MWRKIVLGGIRAFVALTCAKQSKMRLTGRNTVYKLILSTLIIVTIFFFVHLRIQGNIKMALLVANGNSAESLNWSNNEIHEKDDLLESVQVLNCFGNSSYTDATIVEKTANLDQNLFEEVLRTVDNISLISVNKYLQSPLISRVGKPNITIAIIVCGDRTEQAMVMLKSAVMFSLDSNLHVVVFSDRDTILKIGSEILSLKLGLNKVSQYGLTFELHLEWYPEEEGDPDWKSMFKTCTTQRLFFPSLLKHHEALIYLDTDILVLSNLTDMWQIFKTQMGEKKMIAVAPASEVNKVYNSRNNLPYYKVNGIHAGLILMNLTQLREFDFETRARAVYTVYREKVRFADQDIINAIFHGFPERVADMTCSYNFYWAHCSTKYRRNTSVIETEETKRGRMCDDVVQKGVRILHGNTQTFYRRIGDYQFIRDAYEAFRDLDLFSGSYDNLFRDLKQMYRDNKNIYCYPLTADLLYHQAEEFLKLFNKMEKSFHENV